MKKTLLDKILSLKSVGIYSCYEIGKILNIPMSKVAEETRNCYKIQDIDSDVRDFNNFFTIRSF